MIRSVPTCDTLVIRLDRRCFLSLLTKCDGWVAVVREYSVRWQRNPESTTSCFRLSGLASLNRNMRYHWILETDLLRRSLSKAPTDERSYMLEMRKLVTVEDSSWAITCWGNLSVNSKHCTWWGDLRALVDAQGGAGRDCGIPWRRGKRISASCSSNVFFCWC